MEYEYDSQIISPRNASCQQCNGNASVHFATTLPTVNCQLSTVNWIHTFSAKEKDTETGYSYFGSRYYSSDLSIWLSVDPQAAKYPSLSPYVYCANNPIKLVDPNGEDIVITSTTDDNGNTSVHIKFTGVLVNKSSQNYTKEDLNKLKNTISNSIKEKYSGEFGDGVTVTTFVDIITEDEKKLENYFVDRDRHQINMVDVV